MTSKTLPILVLVMISSLGACGGGGGGGAPANSLTGNTNPPPINPPPVTQPPPAPVTFSASLMEIEMREISTDQAVIITGLPLQGSTIRLNQ